MNLEELNAQIRILQTDLMEARQRCRAAEREAHEASDMLRFYQRKTAEAGDNLTLINAQIVKALDQAIEWARTDPERTVEVLELIREAIGPNRETIKETPTP